MNDILRFFKGLFIKPRSSTASNQLGDFEVLSSDNKAHFHNGTSNSALVTEVHTATLTNKTIDADLNFIGNIDNDDIKAAAGIDASKVADASVSNTEFQYLDGVTSNIQTQLNNTASAGALTAHIADTTTHGTTGDIVGTSDTQVLTSKTIDADLNTLSNIEDADIKALAAIQRSKIASGTANHVVINSGAGALSSEAQLALSRGGSGLNNTQLNDSTTTGSSAALNALAGYVRLINASLVSLASIPVALGGTKISISNATGVSVTVIDGAGITTGSGNDILLDNEASLSLVYDSIATSWLVVGGTGSGGGSWVTFPTQTISAAGTVSSSLLFGFQLRRVQGNAAPITLSTTPFGASGGWEDGTVIRLVGQSNANTVTITNNDVAKGAILNGNCTLGFLDVLELQYDLSLDRWIENSRN